MGACFEVSIPADDDWRRSRPRLQKKNNTTKRFTESRTVVVVSERGDSRYGRLEYGDNQDSRTRSRIINTVESDDDHNYYSKMYR